MVIPMSSSERPLGGTILGQIFKITDDEAGTLKFIENWDLTTEDGQWSTEGHKFLPGVEWNEDNADLETIKEAIETFFNAGRDDDDPSLISCSIDYDQSDDGNHGELKLSVDRAQQRMGFQGLDIAESVLPNREFRGRVEPV
jgi:hypothetical protein